MNIHFSQHNSLPFMEASYNCYRNCVRMHNIPFSFRPLSVQHSRSMHTPFISSLANFLMTSTLFSRSFSFTSQTPRHFTKFFIPINHDIHARQDAEKANRKGKEHLSASNEPRLTAHQKSLRIAVNETQAGYDAISTLFKELELKNPSISELSLLLTIRQNFWNLHEKKALGSNDLSRFRMETAKQKKLDFFLIALLENEIENSKNLAVPISNFLGLLSSIHRENTLPSIVHNALEHANFTLPTETEIEEITTDITELLLYAEKQSNILFLNHLTKFAKQFRKSGYTTVADHYEATIDQFLQLNHSLSVENIDIFLNKWNELLNEFDQEHQLFLELDKAEKTLQDCSDLASKWMAKNHAETNEKAFFIISKIDKLASFTDRKKELSTSKDIETYIENTNQFVKMAKSELR